MRVAITTWCGRVSPVFDVAGRLLLVEFKGGSEASRIEAALGEAEPMARARRLSEMGTDVLICGAVSRPVEAALVSAGIQVMSQTCGPVEEVLQAFVAGRLQDAAFSMPGCCGRRRRLRSRRYGRRATSRTTKVEMP
jgi:predicted Fe-Mo cluster-binding NifX family protein